MSFPWGRHCPSASRRFRHFKLSRSAQDCTAAVVTTASGAKISRSSSGVSLQVEQGNTRIELTLRRTPDWGTVCNRLELIDGTKLQQRLIDLATADTNLH